MSPERRGPEVSWVVGFVDGDDVTAANPVVAGRAAGPQVEAQEPIAAAGDALPGRIEVDHRRDRLVNSSYLLRVERDRMG